MYGLTNLTGTVIQPCVKIRSRALPDFFFAGCKAMNLFNKIKNYFGKKESASSEQKSLDFLLMISFIIGQGFLQPVLFRLQTVKHQLMYAIVLFGILLALSVRHKKHNKWKWPGVSVSNIFSVLFQLTAGTAILANWASNILSSPDMKTAPLYQGEIETVLIDALNLIGLALADPFWAHFYLTAIGALAFSILNSLNIMMFDQEKFLACCKNPSPLTRQDIKSGIWKFLRRPLKIQTSSGVSEKGETKRRFFFTKIISELESSRELEIELTEESVEVSFYITPDDGMKKNGPFFLFLGVGFTFLVFLGIPQFLITSFEAEDFYLRLYMAFSTLWATALAYGMYRLFIHFALEKQVLVFCNDYLEIGKRVLGSYNSIIKFFGNR